MVLHPAALFVEHSFVIFYPARRTVTTEVRGAQAVGRDLDQGYYRVRSLAETL
jgi:hypothetical protein